MSLVLASFSFFPWGSAEPVSKWNSVKPVDSHPLMDIIDHMSPDEAERTLSRHKRGLFYLPNGTEWSLTSELKIPLSDEAQITITVPVKYVFDGNCDVMSSCEENKNQYRDLRTQMSIINVIEQTLGKMGLDGKSCVLRAVCEINETPIGQFSFMGEIITLLLTLRKEHKERTFLKEYIEAETLGAKGKDLCWKKYSTCPISILTLHSQYKNTANLASNMIEGARSHTSR